MKSQSFCQILHRVCRLLKSHFHILYKFTEGSSMLISRTPEFVEDSQKATVHREHTPHHCDYHRVKQRCTAAERRNNRCDFGKWHQWRLGRDSVENCGQVEKVGQHNERCWSDCEGNYTSRLWPFLLCLGVLMMFLMPVELMGRPWVADLYFIAQSTHNPVMETSEIVT